MADLEFDTQYKYYASYWAKLPAPLLGVHIIKLASRDDETEQVVEKKGLKVLAVIKDSPAAKAGILRGDVLYKISDVELNKPEELSSVVRKFQLVQRHLRIGYNRAARLLEQMEKSGLVSALSSSGNRDLLVPRRDE